MRGCANCQVLVSFRNQERFNAVVGLLRKFDAECRQLDPARQEEVTNEWGKGITQVEPAREVPEVNRCTLCCQGRGNTNSVSVILRGNSLTRRPVCSVQRPCGACCDASWPPSASLLPHGHSAPAICSPLRQRRDTWPMK